MAIQRQALAHQWGDGKGSYRQPDASMAPEVYPLTLWVVVLNRDLQASLESAKDFPEK